MFKVLELIDNFCSKAKHRKWVQWCKSCETFQVSWVFLIAKYSLGSVLLYQCKIHWQLLFLSRLYKYLEQVTQLYPATKSVTFSPEEIHEILTILQDLNQEKATLNGVEIDLLFYELMRSNEVRMLQVNNVKLIYKKQYIDDLLNISKKWGIYLIHL